MNLKVASELRNLFETNRSEFENKLTAQLRKNEDFLRDLFFPWRSSSRATIATVDVEELEVDNDGSGVVHCMYVEHVYMGCKDMDTEDEKPGSLNFTYLRDQDEICFQESTRPERTTIDEF